MNGLLWALIPIWYPIHHKSDLAVFVILLSFQDDQNDVYDEDGWSLVSRSVWTMDSEITDSLCCDINKGMSYTRILFSSF